MGLAGIVRNGVALANRITEASGGLQADVSLERWNGNDAYGKPTFAAAVTLSALVDETRRKRRMSDGTEVTHNGTVTFLAPIASLGVSGRKEPLDPRDRITLPSGYTGPIAEVKDALVDPGTSQPYLFTVVLG